MDRAEQTEGQIRHDINKTDRQLDKTDRHTESDRPSQTQTFREIEDTDIIT